MDLSWEARVPELLVASLLGHRETQPESAPDKEEAEMLLESLNPARPEAQYGRLQKWPHILPITVRRLFAL